MTDLEQQLKRIVDLLEARLGDSDGYLPAEPMTPSEFEEEYPVEAAMQIAVKLMMAARATPADHSDTYANACLSEQIEVDFSQDPRPDQAYNRACRDCAEAVRTIASRSATPADQEPIYQVQTGDCWLDMTREQYENHSKTRPTRILYAQAPQPEAQSVRDAKDTERLDFMLANTAFTVLCNRDGSIQQYQLMTQDEDENYHVLHNERRFYNTEREAIDAAIESSAPPQKPVSDEVKP